MEKIIVFGSNGMLGRYITQYFTEQGKYKVIGLTRKEYEVSYSRLAEVEEVCSRYEVDSATCVINCIGLIPQRCKDPTLYFLYNTVFPNYLASICVRRGAQLIQPTTDCVFSGMRGGYVESDIHDEKGLYGISKSLGEPSSATVIRTSIIGEELENKCSFLEFVRNSSSTIQGWDHHRWNGITCFQYCKVMDAILTENLFWKGVRHIYSPTSVTKYELAEMIKSVYDVPVEIQRITGDKPIDKTLYSQYSIVPCPIPSLWEQLKEQQRFVLKDI